MSATKDVQQQTFFTLQVMRGAAASFVVFHHFCLTIEQYHHTEPFISRIGSADFIGASGVDIFFVISGFIIFYTMRDLGGKGPALGFARHRIIRVMPLYWLWTTVYLALWATGLAFREAHVTPALMVASYLLVPYLRGGIPPSYHPLLDQGWTLSFEMYFYLITFFIIMFSFTRQRLIGLAVVLGIFFVAAKTLALPTEAVQVVGSPMIVEFLAGAVIAVLMTQQEPLIRRLFPSPIPIALIASGFGIIALSAALPNPSASRGIIWGPAGTVIVLGAALSTWKPRGYPGRLAVFLGTASYSIYLTHGLVTLPLGTLLKRNIGQSVPPDLIILIGTIVTILGCSLLYLVCERPLLHWLRPRKPPPPLPAGVSERYSVKVSNVSTHETDSAG